MSELALQLIRENIEKHRRGDDATFLDLGNCGMTEVPEEIGECVWVEELILANEWWPKEEKGRRISQNSGPVNNIIYLSNRLALLKNLKKLFAGGGYTKNSAILICRKSLG